MTERNDNNNNNGYVPEKLFELRNQQASRLKDVKIEI